MALTDDLIEDIADEHGGCCVLRSGKPAVREVIWFGGNLTPFARAIESAACAERDARIAELERQLAEARKDAERWVHACKCNNKNINVSAWDNDAMEFVGYAMKKEAIDAIADAEIAAMQKG